MIEALICDALRSKNLPANYINNNINSYGMHIYDKDGVIRIQ